MTTDLPKLLTALATADDPKVRAWVPELWRGCDHFAAFAVATIRYLYGYDEGRVHAQRPESEAEALCRCHWEDMLDERKVVIELARADGFILLVKAKCSHKIVQQLFDAGTDDCVYPSRLAATIAAVVAVTGVEVKP